MSRYTVVDIVGSARLRASVGVAIGCNGCGNKLFLI